ncbi:formate/nitrite transporter family protein [Luteolibacter pohnpeiensis]|uniref:Formate/nitrite transporter family protein n=1 Tax=Luteolibacter pohnpeiensis TaxID=454153 RepID=A0A934S4C4_9BACT|nr:formate/nitrite transporter family protein [Luteolibacter pohnpeiensis]MBK1882077.1 formate/nitrite transporter family protein [Luteolibacter pohnpeiensis]
MPKPRFLIPGGKRKCCKNELSGAEDEFIHPLANSSDEATFGLMWESDQKAKDQEHAEAMQEADERTAPPGKVVYHAILNEADFELSRPSAALAWSGLAAGLSMGFSVATPALLRSFLPEAEWTPLLSKLGYTIGFLIVILGRQQLFTENTLTPVLQLLKCKKLSVFWNVARLWGIVLLANLSGGFAFAWIAAHGDVFDPSVREEFAKIGREAMAHSFGVTMVRAVFAGWLIAMMVWLMPFAEVARVWVIIIISYVVGIGHFAHIIAGSIESFYLVVTSEISIWKSLGSFVIPTLLGNIVGGVALVSALAHAQFNREENAKN